MRRTTLKVLRDLKAMRGRILFMILALAAGLISLGTVLSVKTVVQREMTHNYLNTVPASATFDVGESGLSNALLKGLRNRKEVAWAERRGTFDGRWRKPGDETWGHGKLFIVEDFSDQRVALIKAEIGAMVPAPGELLVERSAMLVLDAEVGDVIEFGTGAKEPVAFTIAGIVHEPALAPAATEQAGYFYGTPETLDLLGESTILNEVRVLVAEDALVAQAVESQVESIATWLGVQGINLHEIRVPPPGQHPHQRPSETVLALFGIFSILTVVLAGFLCASLLSLIMARQIREVAVMKALGATAAQIRRMYVGFLGAVSLCALLVAFVPSWALGRAGINTIMTLLNFDVANYSVPSWVIAVTVAVGLLLPLLTAAPAIFRASQMSIIDGLNEYGAKVPKASRSPFIAVFKNRVLLIALRNALRVPRRLMLTVGLLAVGGGLFVASVSVADSWEAMTAEVLETRRYDVQVDLARAPAEDLILASASRVETWGSVPVTFVSKSGLPISRTYPDGGHGSFSMVAVPRAIELVTFSLREGRWLLPDEADGVVLNQLAAAWLGPEALDQPIDLVVEGKMERWQVVGIVEEVAAPATAYISIEAFSKRLDEQARSLRISTRSSRDAEGTRLDIAHIEEELAEKGLTIVRSVPLELLYNAMGEHVVILIRSLLGLALMMAIVGVIALGSTMSTSVVERTRELGILQAIGARPSQVRGVVLLESWCITLMSLPLSLIVALPLASLIGQVVGQLAFMLPLPLTMSWHAFALWSIGVMIVSSLSSLGPTRIATQMTIREAVSHV